MEIEGYYIKKGNDLLAALYDAGFIRDDISFVSLTSLGEFLGFMLQSNAEMATKTAMLTADIKRKRK